MFATASGRVRRNRLSDFASVMANGKIAMKLDAGDRLVGVETCAAGENVLLAARSGKCIRFPVDDVRVFAGRTSTGVRGMRLAKKDRIVSMTVLRHADLDTASRDAYLRHARRRTDGNGSEPENGLPPETVARLEEQEEFILSITENGYGKRTSAYEYRTTGRGGQGIVNIETSKRNGPVVATFPVEESDEIMLVSDAGTLIRSPVTDIRIAGRNTQGVTLFDTAEGERVVSAARFARGFDEVGNGNGNGEAAQ